MLADRRTLSSPGRHGAPREVLGWCQKQPPTQPCGLPGSSLAKSLNLLSASFRHPLATFSASSQLKSKVIKKQNSKKSRLTL